MRRATLTCERRLVDASKAQQQIVARRAGSSAAVAAGAQWTAREAATVITAHAPAAARPAHRLRSNHHRRLHCGCVKWGGLKCGGLQFAAVWARFPARRTARPVARRSDVGTGPPIAIRPGNGLDESTGLNSALAFQGSTSFCAAATVRAVTGSPTQRPDAANDWPAGHAPQTPSRCD